MCCQRARAGHSSPIPGSDQAATGLCFSLGIVLFSGSLYLMTLAGLKLGLVTPLGGVLFLIGWACLGLLAWRRTA